MLAIAKPQKPTEKPEYRPFLLDEHSSNEPTELSLIYYIRDVCYHYYIKVSNERIEEEELNLKKSRLVRIYQRNHVDPHGIGAAFLLRAQKVLEIVDEREVEFL